MVVRRKRFFCLNNDSATIGYFDGLNKKGNIKVHHQCYAIHDDSKQCPEEPAYFVFRVDNRNEKIYLASKLLLKEKYGLTISIALQNI